MYVYLYWLRLFVYLCVGHETKDAHSGLEGLLVQQCWESAGSKSHFSFLKDPTFYLPLVDCSEMWRKRDNVDHDENDFDWQIIIMMTSMMMMITLVMMALIMMMMTVALTRGQLLCHPLPIIGEINRYTGGRSHTMIHYSILTSDIVTDNYTGIHYSTQWYIEQAKRIHCIVQCIFYTIIQWYTFTHFASLFPKYKRYKLQKCAGQSRMGNGGIIR